MGIPLAYPAGNIQRRRGNRCQDRPRQHTSEPNGTAKFNVMARNENVGVGSRVRDLLIQVPNLHASSVIGHSNLKDAAGAVEGNPLVLVCVPHLADGVNVTIPRAAYTRRHDGSCKNLVTEASFHARHPA